MRPRSVITVILGALLALLGAAALVFTRGALCPIPLVVGVALLFLGWRGDRIGLIIFGHAVVVLGCFLVTWGVYLLPHSRPVLAHIFGRPFFWGLFSIFGGICAIYHGFCRRVRCAAQTDR